MHDKFDKSIYGVNQGNVLSCLWHSISRNRCKYSAKRSEESDRLLNGYVAILETAKIL